MAARAVAARLGIDTAEPEVLRVSHGLVVAFGPVVVRVGEAHSPFGPGTDWQRHAVALAAHLAAAGAPVVAPAEAVPPGPHDHDGLVVTFWQRVDAVPGPLDAAAAGRGLRLVHELASSYAGPLPGFWPPEQGRRLLDDAGFRATLAAAELSLLRAASERVLARLPAGSPQQPLHGDAHVGNCIQTAAGPLWVDFDETCRGPLEWDAASMVSRLHVLGPDPPTEAAYEEAFGDRFSPFELEPFVELRVLLVAEWLALALARFPEGRPDLDLRLEWWRERLRRPS